MKLHQLAFAYTVAIFDGLAVFLIMAYSLLLNKANVAIARVATLHWANYSWSGAILMLIEHLICGFILGWLFAWVYNRFVKE